MGKIALKTPAQGEALVLEPITETIAAHLDANCSSAILEGIRERAQDELDPKHAEEASRRERSVDPRLTVAQAREKRDQAEDAAHEARRIAVAIQTLDETLPAVVGPAVSFQSAPSDRPEIP